jgi:hypothetical protein
VCVCLSSHPSRRDAGPRSFRTAERSRPRTRDRDRSMPGGWSVRGIRWCGVGWRESHCRARRKSQP